MRTGRLIVEGHGEVLAAPVLMNRLWHFLGLSSDVHWDETAIRAQKDLKRRGGVEEASKLVRSKSNTAMLLVLRDDEDGCPAVSGPETALWLQELGLPFPAASVMAYREYETWFLPSASTMVGKKLGKRPGLLPGATFTPPWEGSRDAKGLLSRNWADGRAYKESEDQLHLTRLMDFSLILGATPPLDSFQVLERALRFLDTAAPGAVYPPPAIR